MGASATPADLAAVSPPRPFRLRIIPPLDTYPSVVSFAQTPAGKAPILLLFGLGLKYSVPDWKVMTLWLALITVLPKRRRLLATLGMLQRTFLLPLEKTEFGRVILSPLIMRACVCAIGGLLFWSAVRFRQSLVGRRPILTLLTAYAILVYIISVFLGSFPGSSVAWRFAIIFSIYLWFICYALLDRDSFSLQLGTFHPF